MQLSRQEKRQKQNEFNEAVAELDPSSSFSNQDLLEMLQENPNIVQELLQQLQADPGSAESLGKLQLPARQVLPALPPPGVCSLVTANGIPCDPGLAYSPLTGSCEWPDNLIEHGCNPEGRNLFPENHSSHN